jgi:hypothetical protein
MIGQLAPAAYRLAPPRGRRAAVSRLLRDQSERCRRGGSGLYAELLALAAEDVRRGGACWRPFAEQPFAVALPLRFMAGVHRLVLTGQAPALAEHFPSTGGDGHADAAREPFLQAVADHPEVIAASLGRPVQTNEVGRCRALVGGFLLVAQETGLPLRLLEIGASAGLNLRWDLYRYEAGGAAWGDARSPVRLLDGHVSAAPYADVEAVVVGRHGCDLLPVDPTDDDGRITLLSYTWGDQPERTRLLDAAVTLARTTPAQVDAADALDWLPSRLAEPSVGVATVVFHSYVMQLLGSRGRSRLADAVAAAGRAASPDAPLAWLRYEFTEGRRASVRLATWPGGEDRVLALASSHGQNIDWGAVRPGRR